ncbi:MAG: aldehyde ferredoxin oxidoreductase C-terminal domain-containing protein, partial [Bacillota bacterium]
TYSQRAYSLLDTLDLCQFCFGYFPPLFDMKYVVELLNAATGWETTFWELMLVGERRINLMRAFNYREGFDSSDDKLPSRLTNPLPEGPAAGQKIDPDKFQQALRDYYRLAGWKEDTGRPTAVKLKELGIDWVDMD